MSLVFGVIGLVIIYAAWKLNTVYSAQIATGRKVHGQIVGQIQKYSGAKTLNALIKVYEGGENRYLLSPIGSNPPSGKVGDTVLVLMDQRNSNRATVPTRIVPIICTVMGFVGAIFVYATFHSIWAFGFQTFDMVLGAVVAGVLYYKYQNFMKGKGQLPSKIKNYMRTASVFTDLLTEEEAEKMLGDDYVPTEKFGDSFEMKPEMARFLQHKEKQQKEKQQSSVGGFVSFLIFGLIGFGMIGFGAWKAQQVYEFKQMASRAPGKIVDREVNRGSGTTYTPVFSYKPNGQENVVRFKGGFSSSHPTWDIGDEVTVLYDPRDPQDAIQEDGLWNYMLSIFFCVLGGFFAFIGLAVLSTTLEKRRQSKPKPYGQRQSTGRTHMG